MITVSVEQIVAVRPGILRISLNTTNGVGLGLSYEIAIAENTFIERSDTNEVEVNLDKLKLEISKKIKEMDFTANLAQALNITGLSWKINDTIPIDAD